MLPDPEKPPVTMRDIAAKLGISRPAVSLALRDRPSISLARRREVQKLAEEMGYRPNASATALASHKSGSSRDTGEVIAWLNHWPDARSFRKHREFEGYWKGALAATEKFGYHLEEFTINQEMPPARIQEILWNRNIRGILIPPMAPTEYLLPWGDFQWERFSVARFGHTITEPFVSLITADQVGAARLAYYKIREKGYRRIGFVTSKTSAERLLFKAGYLTAQWELEKNIKLTPLVLDGSQPSMMQAKFEKWLKKLTPDAIFSELHEVRTMLETAGYDVPKDIGLATSSVLDGDANAGIFQNPEEIGRVAVLMIISLIYDNSKGIPKLARQVLIPPTWVDGSHLPDRRVKS